VAAALDPVRLAELVDLAERPRVDGWSLRAALCRYAQPQPERAGALLSLIRRIEATFAQNLAELRSDGPDLLRQAEDLRSPEDIADDIPLLVALMAISAEIDALGTNVAAWAVDREGDRPDEAIDAVTDHATTALNRLGVPEEAPPPRGARGRG